VRSSVEGIWFDADSSKASSATLSRDGVDVAVHITGRVESARLADLEIAPRLGDTPRRLHFPNGGLFETPANDAIDRMLASTGTGHAGWLHRLEQHWQLGVLMILPAAALLWLAATLGVPALAKSVAAHLPHSVTRGLAEEVLASLAQFGFEESQLSEQQRAYLNREFQRLSGQMQLGPDCELRFYATESIGPNAFALPACIVVFTDQLVMLAEHDNELLAVLLHELGHIRYQHALRHVVQGALLSFVLVAITGDATQISSAVAAVPLLLLELGYSREFEREADRFAYATMRAEQVPLRAFPDILMRIEAYWGDAPTDARDGEGANWSRYLATHPSSDERAALFRSPDQ